MEVLVEWVLEPVLEDAAPLIGIFWYLSFFLPFLQNINLSYTVWKFRKISAAQILREIKFGIFGVSKPTTLIFLAS